MKRFQLLPVNGEAEARAECAAPPMDLVAGGGHAPVGLSADEQDQVWQRWRRGESLRLIARRLGKRGPSVRAFVLQTGGVQCPPPRRAARALLLAEREEISRGLAAGDSSEDPVMRVSHETIYLSLFVQSRGALRRELQRCLRTGRAMRYPRGERLPQGRGPLRDVVLISERPAEVEDRAVPGHWEGDVLFGRAAPPVADLGPGQGDGRARQVHGRHRRGGLFL
jgi:IS30 family transposase